MANKPSTRDVKTIIYILLALLAIVMFATRYLSYEYQFYALLFAGGIIFVVFAMVFGLEENR